MQISEESIPVPWGHIAAKTWGDSHAPPVLCLHGIMDNANTFDTLIPMLPSSFFYVAVDFPGHGQSSNYPPERVPDQLGLAFTVHRVVRHYGWSRVQIIGHSLGGIVSLYYASLYPDVVKNLVGFDCSSYNFPRTTTEAIGYIVQLHEKLLDLEKKMMRRKAPQYTFDELLQRLMTKRPSFTEEAAKILLKRGTKLDGVHYAFTADQRFKLPITPLLTEAQIKELFSHIKCPFLYIRASESVSKMPSAPKFTEIISSVFPSTLGSKYTYKVVEGSHDVHLLHPERVAGDVAAHLCLMNSSL